MKHDNAIDAGNEKRRFFAVPLFIADYGERKAEASMDGFSISDLDSSPAADEALTQLLYEVYVESKFTSPESATTLFAPAAVRARGMVFAARAIDGTLIGTGTLVWGGSSASLLAPRGDAELHLLAVRRRARGRGAGAALVAHLLAMAAAGGARTVWLWTQPTMTAAQRLYERAGFARAPQYDFARADTPFWVYRRSLAELSDPQRVATGST